MWWVILVLLLSGCASQVVEVSEDTGVWIESVSSRNDSERGFLLEVCSSDPLFQGAFIPFSVEVGSRSTIVDDAPYEQVSESCIVVRYDIERGVQEDLLSFGEISFEIDPEERIEQDRSDVRFTYRPEHVCIDSDDDNPFLSGFVSARADGETLFILDSCTNDTATEYVCDGNGRVEILLYECRDGCAGGSCRCLNSETCLADGSALRI
jgi:hypothetical protein